MNKFLCFFLFSSILNFGYSQTEEDFIQIIKVYYAKNNKTKACEESKKGLTKYPSSARITKLQALVCGNKIGSQNPPITKGPIPQVNGAKPQNPITQNPIPQGSIPQRPTPQGPIIPEPVKIVNVSTGFKRIAGQNKVEWSKSLTDNAVSITIRYTVKGVGVLVDERVTGRTYHIYDPGTSRAHGRSTKVELIVDYGDKKVNESGTLVLDNQFFVCSAN